MNKAHPRKSPRKVPTMHNAIRKYCSMHIFMSTCKYNTLHEIVHSFNKNINSLWTFPALFKIKSLRAVSVSM